MLLFILLTVNLKLFAQSESPESNKDLRRGKIIVSLESLTEKEQLKLEGMNSGDFYLTLGKEKSEEMKKISRTEAENFEQKFATIMFKLQYELPQDPDSCKPSWVLFMHGEKYNVCEKSDQKNQEIEQFYTTFKIFK